MMSATRMMVVGLLLTGCDPSVGKTLAHLQAQVQAWVEPPTTNDASKAKPPMQPSAAGSVLVSAGKAGERTSLDAAAGSNGNGGPLGAGANGERSDGASGNGSSATANGARRIDGGVDDQTGRLPDLPTFASGKRKLYRRTQTRDAETIDLVMTTDHDPNDVAAFYERELDAMGVSVRKIRMHLGSTERVSLFGRQGDVYFSGEVEREHLHELTRVSLRLERSPDRRTN